MHCQGGALRFLRAAGVALPALGLALPAAADSSLLAVRPLSGPAAGGTSVSIYGTAIVAGSTVSVGGVVATGITVVGPTRIDALVPAFAPGSTNDVAVTPPGGSAVTLNNAWFARFLDVPPAYLFARPIEKLRRRGITTGCGGGNYCPDDSVTRAQMAIFILRGEHGSGYHPPAATGTVFDDVPASAFGADWIEQFAAEGITTGCGGKNYCPNNPVTRGEMAVFLLRAKYGSAFNPPAPVGKFLDVTPTTPFAKWIERLAADAITSGCGGGNFCPTSSNTRGQMAVFLTKTFADSSQHLIAEALAYGDIDYPTSLLYRAYAMFWDRRLPARYEGSGSIGEDPKFFLEVKTVWSELPADAQTALQPFLLRPDEPGSPFGPPPAGQRPSAVQPDTNCQTSWIGLDTPGGNFRVHLCASGNDTDDNMVRAKIAGIADDLWTKETRAWPLGMGPPKSDGTAGGSANIDVYLLDPNQCSPRGDPGDCDSIPGKALACAVSADPVTRNSRGRQISSGYMLLARDRVNASGFKSDFAHEFFHVLQFAYNIDILDSDTDIRINGEAVLRSSWFVEASATWAEWNWVPETSNDEVHTRFVNLFQRSDESLMEVTFDEDHPYASYIWPFFVQQEEGGPVPVFRAWADIEGAFDPQNVTDAVDGQLSFQDHFRDFAVRNVNLDLPGNPLGTTYRQMYGAFPPNVSHKLAHNGSIGLGISPKTSVDVEPLAAQYDEFTFSPEVRKIVFRFDKLPSAQADVDLIVRIKTQWKRVKVDLAKPPVFCREKPDEDVDTVIVIVSNHDKAEGQSFSSSYKIEPKSSCCGEIAEATAWNMNVTFGYVHTGTVFDVEIRADQSANLSGRLTPVVSSPGTASFVTNQLTGTGSVHDQEIFQSGDPAEITASGSPVSGSGATLEIDLVQCTYRFLAAPFVDGPPLPSGPPVAVPVGEAHGENHDLRDFVDAISGSQGFPAHSGSWLATHADQDSYVTGGLGQLIFADPSNEELAGSAAVNWTFTPELPPSPP